MRELSTKYRNIWPGPLTHANCNSEAQLLDSGKFFYKGHKFFIKIYLAELAVSYLVRQGIQLMGKSPSLLNNDMMRILKMIQVLQQYKFYVLS